MVRFSLVFILTIVGIAHNFLLYTVLDIILVVSDLVFILFRDKIINGFEKCSEKNGIWLL